MHNHQIILDLAIVVFDLFFEQDCLWAHYRVDRSAIVAFEFMFLGLQPQRQVNQSESERSMSHTYVGDTVSQEWQTSIIFSLNS